MELLVGVLNRQTCLRQALDMNVPRGPSIAGDLHSIDRADVEVASDAVLDQIDYRVLAIFSQKYLLDRTLYSVVSLASSDDCAKLIWPLWMNPVADSTTEGSKKKTASSDSSHLGMHFLKRHRASL